MKQFTDAFIKEIQNTFNWLLDSVSFNVNWYENYFWGLICISVFVWTLEIIYPWRKDQSIFRKDFWIDAFYMFFNFFLFSIIISGFYKVIAVFFSNYNINLSSIALLNANSLPNWLQLVLFFIVLDFLQWFTHLLLHRFEFLWHFHKVHHSVKEMGFAAHLRFHWMENIFYKPLKTFGVMLLFGFEPNQAYIVHFIAILIGHLNHANIKLTWGPLKYIINNPVMHLYHHVRTLPKGTNGVNYGISLSLWDYLFKTNYIPEDSGTIEIGFEGDEQFPKTFVSQLWYGFTRFKK